MAEGRSRHTATLLQDGKVLVVGGAGTSGASALVELFDPGSESWTHMKSMSQDRYFHTATLLEDGRVLVVGGSNKDPLAYAEVYDPSRNAWTDKAPMNTPRRQHTATLLPDGRVLVVGGNTTRSGGSRTASSEIYDPITGVWTAAADKNIRVGSHTAVLLANGRVLVTGDFIRPPNAADTDGLMLDTIVPLAELYDTATNSWSFTGQMTHRRSWPTATLLDDGTALVVGGGSASVQRPTAEIYYPATNTWSPTDRFSRDRFGHTETILGNGAVFDPSSGTWESAGRMLRARQSPVLNLLLDGSILVRGGFDGDGWITSSEKFDPVTNKWAER